MTQTAVKKVTSEHTVEICDRKSIKMTGVEEVGNFSESMIDIKLKSGAIILKGTGLNILKLDTDAGELSISGEITSLQYAKLKQKKSVMEGLFK